MKNDDEFLDGVYKKAEHYSTHKYDVDGFTRATTDFIKKYAGVTIAALLIIVAVPSLYILKTTNKASMIEQSAAMPLQRSITQPAAPQPQAGEPSVAAFSADAGAGAAAAGEFSVPIETLSVAEIATEADTVVLATVKRIKNSVYDNDIDNSMSTTVVFEAEDVLKGDLSEKSTFNVKVVGGFDEKNNNFIPYEATFAKKELAILCLTKSSDDADTYALTFSSSGKFAQTDEVGFFQDTLGNTTCVTELEKIIN